MVRAKFRLVGRHMTDEIATLAAGVTLAIIVAVLARLV
jgi:hypothetical protein